MLFIRLDDAEQGLDEEVHAGNSERDIQQDQIRNEIDRNLRVTRIQRPHLSICIGYLDKVLATKNKQIAGQYSDECVADNECQQCSNQS